MTDLCMLILHALMSVLACWLPRLLRVHVADAPRAY